MKAAPRPKNLVSIVLKDSRFEDFRALKASNLAEGLEDFKVFDFVTFTYASLAATGALARHLQHPTAC